jgi:very-short-patch-repair endonuclease
MLRAKRDSPDLEGMLAEKIAAAGLPAPQRQSRVPWAGTGRRFRADLLFPDQKLIIEVDGGTWSGGRHTSGAGYDRDCIKQNLALLNGYSTMRYTSRMVRDGTALEFIRRKLNNGVGSELDSGSKDWETFAGVGKKPRKPPAKKSGLALDV